jgi:hypothetical protein
MTLSVRPDEMTSMIRRTQKALFETPHLGSSHSLADYAGLIETGAAHEVPDTARAHALGFSAEWLLRLA